MNNLNFFRNLNDLIHWFLDVKYQPSDDRLTSFEINTQWVRKLFRYSGLGPVDQ
jgi:hypothetical protein